MESGERGRGGHGEVQEEQGWDEGVALHILGGHISEGPLCKAAGHG